MFDFALLNEAASQPIHPDRRQQFQTHYDEALLLLQDFKAEGYPKDLLQAAIAELFLALRYQRSRPEPYVWLAYALLVAQAPRQAMPYLRRARELAPEHALVRSLWQHCQRI